MGNTLSAEDALLEEVRKLSRKPDIATLKSSTYLYLNNNNLSSVPPGVFLLTGLERLELGDNKLSSLPAQISCLTGLTRLDIFLNPMEELPAQITALTNLKQLYINVGNPQTIKRAPRGISNLPCWNNTGHRDYEHIRALQLYDPVVASPNIQSGIYAAPTSRLARGNYADLLTMDFEKKENILGKGGFGMVFKVQLKAGLFAVKLVGNASLLTAADGSGPEKEGNMMLELQHPNILTLFDFGFRGRDLLLVMEFADGGELCSLVKKQGALSLDLTLKYGLHIIQGLVYLHTRPRPIQHRDLKTENVLLVNGVAKLTDFGLAKSGVSVNSVSKFGGSKNWSPPEAFEIGKSMGLPSDVYSYGVVLWSMLSGEYPYEGMTDGQVGSYVTNALIHKCWERTYENRINSQQVEAGLKGIISNPAAVQATPRMGSVKDMNVQRLTAYLEEKNANPRLIQVCQETPLTGAEFVALTEADLKELVPDLKNVQIRTALNLVEEAKRT